MLKNYKKSYLVINVILALTLVILSTNLLIFRQASYLFCILCTLIPFIIITSIYGYEFKRRRFMYEATFYIFSYCLLFMLITYIIGIFIGFTSNVYKLDFSNLIHNIIPYTALILSSELLRYEITRKGDGSVASHILTVIILILVDLTIFLNTYNLNIVDEQIKYICAILLPSTFKNIVLTYFTRISGPLPSLIYRIIIDLKLVILPIFPSFGLYFDCTINCILPVLMFALVEINLKKFRNKGIDAINVKNHFIYKYLLIFVLFIVTLSVNLLASGKFKYTILSIGSGSMTPNINKGDAVFCEKLDDKSPQIGDVIVFKKDGKNIVHRVIEIVDLNDNEKIYFTKGDSNEGPDGYPIEKKDIYGIVKFRIRYIGIPSVKLKELLYN